MKTAFGVIASLLLMNAYLAGSVRLRLSGIQGATSIILFFFLAFAALQLVVPLLDWSRAPIDHSLDGPFYEMLVQASYLSLGVMSCLFVFMFLADVITLVVWTFLPAGAIKPFGYAVLSVVSLLTIGAVGVGLSNAGKIEVSRVEMRVRNLPAALDGFTIAQISDVHIGRFLKRDFAQKIVDTVNGLKPDVIVLTGDLIDGFPDLLAAELVPFGLLHAPHGKFYVTGNHEYYWGAGPWVEEVRKLGLHALENAHAIVEKDGQQLVLGGVNDPTTLRMGVGDPPSARRAALGAPEGVAKILLSHQPKLHKQAITAGFDAQISGHTHSGQYFPFTLIIGLFEPYHRGLYDLNGFALYVSRGVGFWGPPLRSQAGEIALITLRVQ